MKHGMNLFGGNIVIPTPDITIFTDTSETGWDVKDGHNPSGGQSVQHERMHINILELKAAFIGIARTAIKEAISVFELCQTALQQVHILIVKVVLSPKNAMNLQKKYGYGVLKIIILSLQLTYQENTVLKQTGFLENLTVIQNGN